ncbi:hypothetical protein CYMTET_5088 [Cymbomonas tetramitiformis]|uniref:Uncharacterized protein n=1 Tax=Cymbomonas tetramitiformis TaxID=36881 RepID=A0AAE0H029_9CHLO|nr:hypothetical protein CYMTET_5088 [Cymbomonas tetramitiformis]
MRAWVVAVALARVEAGAQKRKRAGAQKQKPAGAQARLGVGAQERMRAGARARCAKSEYGEVCTKVRVGVGGGARGAVTRLDDIYTKVIRRYVIRL